MRHLARALSISTLAAACTSAHFSHPEEGTTRASSIRPVTDVHRRNITNIVTQRTKSSSETASSECPQEPHIVTEGNLSVTFPKHRSIFGTPIAFVLRGASEDDPPREGVITVWNQDGNLVVEISEEGRKCSYAYKPDLTQKIIGNPSAFQSLRFDQIGNSFEATNELDSRGSIDSASVMHCAHALIRHNGRGDLTIFRNTANLSFTEGDNDMRTKAAIAFANGFEATGCQFDNWKGRISGLLGRPPAPVPMKKNRGTDAPPALVITFKLLESD